MMEEFLLRLQETLPIHAIAGIFPKKTEHQYFNILEWQRYHIAGQNQSK